MPELDFSDLLLTETKPTPSTTASQTETTPSNGNAGLNFSDLFEAPKIESTKEPYSFISIDTTPKRKKSFASQALDFIKMTPSDSDKITDADATYTLSKIMERPIEDVMKMSKEQRRAAIMQKTGVYTQPTEKEYFQGLINMAGLTLGVASPKALLSGVLKFAAVHEAINKAIQGITGKDIWNLKEEDVGQLAGPNATTDQREAWELIRFGGEIGLSSALNRKNLSEAWKNLKDVGETAIATAKTAGEIAGEVAKTAGKTIRELPSLAKETIAEIRTGLQEGRTIRESLKNLSKEDQTVLKTWLSDIEAYGGQGISPEYVFERQFPGVPSRPTAKAKVEIVEPTRVTREGITIEQAKTELAKAKAEGRTQEVAKLTEDIAGTLKGPYDITPKTVLFKPSEVAFLAPKWTLADLRGMKYSDYANAEGDRHQQYTDAKEPYEIKIKELKEELKQKGTDKKVVKAEIAQYSTFVAGMESAYDDAWMKNAEDLRNEIKQEAEKKGVKFDTDEEWVDFLDNVTMELDHQDGAAATRNWDKTVGEVIDEGIQDALPEKPTPAGEGKVKYPFKEYQNKIIATINGEQVTFPYNPRNGIVKLPKDMSMYEVQEKYDFNMGQEIGIDSFREILTYGEEIPEGVKAEDYLKLKSTQPPTPSGGEKGNLDFSDLTEEKKELAAPKAEQFPVTENEAFKRRLVDEIRHSAEKIMRPGESLEENIQRTVAWIATTLVNDEASTNEELVHHFIKEGGFSEDTARFFVNNRVNVQGKVDAAFATYGKLRAQQEEQKLAPQKKPKIKITKFNIIPTEEGGIKGEIVSERTLAPEEEVKSTFEIPPEKETPIKKRIQETDQATRLRQFMEVFLPYLRKNELPKTPTEIREVLRLRFGTVEFDRVMKEDPARTHDEIYDALEGALNQLAKEEQTYADTDFTREIKRAQELEERLPLRARSLGTIELQQFSTPLTLSAAVAKAAGIEWNDTVLEPTAGTGNIATAAQAYSHTPGVIIVNELDPRRVEVLHTLEFQHIKNEDALKLEGVHPTVIVGNPPWGAAATGKYAKIPAPWGEAQNLDQRFVARALEMLPDGGRLVFLMSPTVLGNEGAQFRRWLKENHSLRALIASPEGSYKYRGSPQMRSVLMVVDKGKAEGDQYPNTVMSSETKDWTEYVKMIDAIPPRLPLKIEEKTGILKGEEGAEHGESRTPVQDTADRGSRAPGERDTGEHGRRAIPGEPERPRLDTDKSTDGTPDDYGAEPEPGTGEPVPAVFRERNIDGGVEGDASKRKDALGSDGFVQSSVNYTSDGINNPHPDKIVESGSLASVETPKLSYLPTPKVIEAHRLGNLSDEQMAGVVLARQAHKNGNSFILADGVGTGKTRIGAAVIMDLLETGDAKRVLYVTKNSSVLDVHLTDDFSVVMTGRAGQKLPYKTVNLSSMGNLANIEIPVYDKSIYAITRFKLSKNPDLAGKLGIDAIVVDEAHEWRSDNEKAKKRITWTKVMNQTAPKCPKLFMTATPGRSIVDYAYIPNTGLWSYNTFDRYIQSVTGREMQKRGFMAAGSAYSSAVSVPLSEQIMRELKMRGLYIARTTSWQGVDFEEKRYELTPEEKKTYDVYVDFLRRVYNSGLKWGKFNKTANKKGIIKGMIQFAMKRWLLDIKLKHAIESMNQDVADGKRVVFFTSGLNGKLESEDEIENMEEKIGRRLSPEERDSIIFDGYLLAAIRSINVEQVEVEEGVEIMREKIPEALQEKATLLEDMKEFGQPVDVEDYVRKHFKGKAMFYTGNTSDGMRRKNLKAWELNRDEKGETPDGFFMSDAGKTGISAHDKVGRRIVVYYGDVDWAAETFEQAIGRVKRTGSKTLPVVKLINLGAGGEQKFISTIATRVKHLGAACRGQAESSLSQFLSQYDLEGEIAHEAARNAWSDLDTEERELFINDKLWEYVKIGKHYEVRIKTYPNKGYYVDNYLYDLNLMHFDKGVELFNKLITTYRAELESVKERVQLRADKATGEVVRHLPLYQNPDNPLDYVDLYEVTDKDANKFGILTGMLTNKMKTFTEYYATRYVSFSGDGQIIQGLRIAGANIPALAKEYGKSVATMVTKENAYAVLMAGDKVKLVTDLTLYKRRDGRIGIQNAKMKDKDKLQKAGAGYDPTGNAWILQPEEEVVQTFIEHYPIPQTEKLADVSEKIGENVDQTIKTIEKERRTGAVGNLPQRIQRTDDTIHGATESSDPEVERRWQEAKGIKEANLFDTIKAAIVTFFSHLKEFPHLADTPEYAKIKHDLRLLQNLKAIAQDKTLRLINHLLFRFGPKKLDLFTRKVVLDDLMYELDRGHALPFGYTSDTLQKDHATISELVEKNPDIAKALDDRKKILDAVKRDLVNAGIMDEEAFKNPSYFRHQVLEYAQAQHLLRTGRLKTPSPGYAKRRHGSLFDINTDYLQAEFEWLSQALKDIEVAKILDRLEKSPLNIKEQLKRQAKTQNEKLLKATEIKGATARNEAGEEHPVTLWDLITKEYNPKMAMGFAKLEALGYVFDRDNDRINFAELAAIAQGTSGEEEEAIIAAKMILKAVAGRKKAIKEYLGNRYKEWYDLVPEGYGLWQPKKGNLFFTAKTIPQRILDKIAEDVGSSVGVTAEDLKNVVVLGGKLKELVLPEELITTIEESYSTISNKDIDRLYAVIFRVPMTLWKKWILFSPLRVFSYNYQNMLGDLSGTFAGNPGALTRVPRAIRELWDYYYKEGSVSRDLQDFIDRGGISTALTAQEIPDINSLNIFRRFGSLPLSEQLNLVKRWFSESIRFSKWREAVLRYAAYIDYLEKVTTGKYGIGPLRSFKYGASKKAEIEGLSDPRDKAARLASDLLGDYGSISSVGKDIRKYLIPFWSWYEINAKRYYRLFANAMGEGPGGAGMGGRAGAGAAILTTGMAGLWALRFAFMWAMFQLWNNLVHPDLEDQISEYDKRKGHLILGKDSKGNIMVRRGQDAFGDFLEWFGLNKAMAMLEKVHNKQMSIEEMALEIAKSPVNKFINGLSPFITGAAAFLFKKKFYEDFTRPIPVRSRLEAGLGMFGPEGKMAYELITKQPRREGGIERYAQETIISRQSGEENAYRKIQGLKREFLEKQGRGGTGDYYTPRTQYYTDYRKALLFKDDVAKKRALRELRKLGATPQDLLRAKKTADPLYGLSIQDRLKFIKWLGSDKVTLKRAVSFYRKTFLVGGGGHYGLRNLGI